jgi:hypothetical protein
MAAGFVFHVVWLRALAAFLLGGGLVLSSALTFMILRGMRPRIAQWLLAASALSIVATMWLAVIYTLGDYKGEVWISIPQMARTHGILNAFGFSLCGLSGWNLGAHTQQNRRAEHVHRRPQTLLSRWG